MRKAFGARPGDHRAIVGAEPQRRRDKRLAELARERGERGADRAVRRDATRDDKGGRLRTGHERDAAAVDEAIDDRGLKGGREIGGGVRPARRGARDRALEPREREMRLVAADERTRQRDGARIALGRDALDRGAARIAEAQKFCRLVKSFARRVVDGCGEAAIGADSFDEEKLAVAARHEQQQIGEAKVGFDKPWAQRMAFEMVDRDERFARRVRERLTGDEPDHHAADQSRAGGRGDRVDVGQRDPGVGEHPFDKRREAIDMRARRDFGNDAAIGAVFGLLPRDAVRQNGPVAGDERGRGFVAARFKAEDQSHNIALPFTRPFIGRASHASSGTMTKLPTPDQPLRIGTRASPLAMAQAHMAVAALIASHGLDPQALEIVPVTATGDKIQDRALAEVGGKALWTRELDAMLDTGVIDVAVHSLKDVETIRDPRFVLAAMLERADPRDRLVVRDGLDAATIADLPYGARLGTSSPRRAAQVKRLRPDLETPLLRGNVATRLAKLNGGDCDATLLAAAGLDRLGMHETGFAQPAEILLPAASQGAIGIECRADDTATRALVAAVDHEPTHRAVAAERALLASLGGDCRSPVAAHAAWQDDGRLRLAAEIFSEDGAEHVAGVVMLSAPADAEALGRRLLAEAPASVRQLFSV